MEVRKRKRRLAITWLLLILCSIGFAFSSIHGLSRLTYPETPVPDTTVKTRNPASDSVYRNHVYGADKLIQQKKYNEALVELDKALLLRPNEPTLKNKILQVKAMAAQQKKDLEEYNQLIASADKYFNSKDYLNAKATYQLALNLIPGDPYASGRLNETMGFLRSQKARNILYDVAVANADKFYESGELDKAKEEYEKAAQILPSDQYAKDRVNEIIKIQVDKQVREELYAQAITKADQLYNSKKYQGALTEYRNALKQKPEEKYPQDRIRELTEILAQMKALEETYQKAIAAADQLFMAKRYPDAKTGYEDALKIKPAEAYPKNRIREIDEILAGLQRTNIEYERYLALADSFYIEKSFIIARQNYQLALQVKPNEAYPKEMLAKAELGMSTMEQTQKAIAEAYAAAIATADKLFMESSWEAARKEYSGALMLKPDEAYPKTRIAEIDKTLERIASQKLQLEEQYASLVKNGDLSFDAKAWDAAFASYTQALQMKPDEQYPKDRIAEIGVIRAELSKQQKAVDEQYAGMIASADQLLAGKQYDEAKARYSEAAGIKPSESYPKTKIAEIDGILAALAKQKQIEGQYAAAIAEGDNLFGLKEYAGAKTKYQAAQAINPVEQYPKTKIAEIDAIFAAEASRLKDIEDRYNSAMANAARLLAEKSYDPAKAEYLKASGLKPQEQLPKDKITEIDGILAQIAAMRSLDEKYSGIIANADRQFTEKKYDESKTAYSEALSLKPAESYPKTRIAEIDGILAELAKQKQIEGQYAAAISEGDNLFGLKEYAGAKAKYQAAQAINPVEQYPRTKIAEIDAIFAAEASRLKDIEDRYNSAMANAARLLAEKSYDPAKAEYLKASELKPQEQLPKDKITEIDGILAQIAAMRSLDEKYSGIVASADRLFSDKKYDESKTAFSEALGLKPAESYPKTKIAEIDGILGAIAKQKQLDDQFAAIVAEADNLFAAKTYDGARTKYQEALALKAGEQYPKTKIGEIDAIFAAEASRLKDMDDRYNAAMENAGRLFAEKSYEPSKAEYLKASGIKPEEKLPKDRIAEIDGILAQIAAQKALDEQYSGIIANADRLFSDKKYDESKTAYSEALGLKPAESYPKTKITEIDGILAAMAKQKQLDDQFAAIVAEADNLFAAKTYDEARTKYQEALALKAGEQYPKTKIGEIDAIFAAEASRLKELDDRYNAAMANAGRLFAEKSYEPSKAEYLKASGIKPEEKLPKDRIAEIDGILAQIAAQKALDEQYSGIIANADRLFSDKKYDESKTAYSEALALKPAETYPKTKIAEIDGIFARLKALDEQYAGLITKADQHLAAKSYAEAKAEYENALMLKAGEQYPKDKIAEIDAALAEIARQKTISDQYKAQLTKADQLFGAKQYEPALAEYTAALAIKAEEQYPKDRISEIQAILAEMKARDDSYRASLKNADQFFAEKKYVEARTEYQNAGAIKPLEQYPKERISEISRILTEMQGKKVTYDNLLQTAGDLLAEREYNKSKELYQQASGIFPEETFPRDRIAYITRTVDSIYRANKGQYDIAVANGDKYYNAFEFDKAIDSYTEAVGFLPMEAYPRDQIAKIRRTIAENAIVDVLKTAVTITAGDEKKFNFEAVNIAARKDNFVYLKIRNLSDKPFNILMRYGKDVQSNGGVVIRNISTDGKVNERLISVRDQDLWYRADNNWISLFPQGGDIEVSFIQVSKVR